MADSGPDDSARGDSPRGDSPRADRPGGDSPRGDRPGGDRPGGDRPRGDPPRGDPPSDASAGSGDGFRPDAPQRFFFDDLAPRPDDPDPGGSGHPDAGRGRDDAGGPDADGPIHPAGPWMPGPSDGEHQAWPTRAVVVALAVVAAVILVGLGLSRQHGSTTADPGTTPRSSVSGTTPGGTTPQSTAPGRAASRLPGGRSIVPGTQRSPGPARVPRSPGTASHPATSRRTAAQHPSSPPPRTAQVPTGALAQPVTVLNNTTITGLAARASQTLHGRGWTIAGTGNYQGRLATTTAYYDPGNATQQQAAAALARQFPQITAVQPRLSGLPGSGLTVVVAPNWPS